MYGRFAGLSGQALASRLAHRAVDFAGLALSISITAHMLHAKVSPFKPLFAGGRTLSAPTEDEDGR